MAKKKKFNVVLKAPFSKAFKKKAVQRTYLEEYTIAEAAEELGIKKGALKRWRDEFEASGESLECEIDEMSVEEKYVWLTTELAIRKEEVAILRALNKYYAEEGLMGNPVDRIIRPGAYKQREDEEDSE